MNKAVFLDRDGVLNTAPIIGGVPSSPSKKNDLHIIPGVRSAINLLKIHGLIPIVVTNQPDIARGKVRIETVSEIHEILCKTLGIEHFYVCPHDDCHECDCRKPQPGLIIKASVDLNIKLEESFMVGDRWKDIEAGQAAGCKSFFIDYSYNETQPCQPFTKVSSLYEAVSLICT